MQMLGAVNYRLLLPQSISSWFSSREVILQMESKVIEFLISLYFLLTCDLWQVIVEETTLALEKIPIKFILPGVGLELNHTMIPLGSKKSKAYFTLKSRGGKYSWCLPPSFTSTAPHQIWSSWVLAPISSAAKAWLITWTAQACNVFLR